VPTRLLFVCLGNICRSPTAEAVMRQVIAERGLDAEVEVDSAGTGAWHAGAPPDPRAARAALRRGVTLTGSARRVTPDDFDDFDLVLAMDEENLRDLLAVAPPQARSRIRKLADVDVPDPYYGDGDGFETVLDLVQDACERLLDEVHPR
jgi:protein-tyrosine phosphatase